MWPWRVCDSCVSDHRELGMVLHSEAVHAGTLSHARNHLCSCVSHVCLLSVVSTIRTRAWCNVLLVVARSDGAAVRAVLRSLQFLSINRAPLKLRVLVPYIHVYSLTGIYMRAVRHEPSQRAGLQQRREATRRHVALVRCRVVAIVPSCYGLRLG